MRLFDALSLEDLIRRYPRRPGTRNIRAILASGQIGATITREELTMIPNSRDPWAFMRAVPGVQIDRVNQAGSESGQQSGFIGKGSSQTDAMWVLDGIVITDPAAVGASPSACQ